MPKSAQGDTDRRIRNAYAMTEYAAAKAELEKIFRQQLQNQVCISPNRVSVSARLGRPNLYRMTDQAFVLIIGRLVEST